MKKKSSNRWLRKFATILFIAILCQVASPIELHAQELKDILRQNKKMEDRDPLGNTAFSWPTHEWQEDEINFSQVFAGAAGARLPMLWLGEPDSAFIARGIGATSTTQHIILERKLVQTMSRGGAVFVLNVYVPHPKAEEWARLRVIQEYKDLLVTEDEVNSLFPLKIKGLEGHFISKDEINFSCNLVVKLPRMVLVNLSGDCRHKGLMIELLESLNFERLVQKINS